MGVPIELLKQSIKDRLLGKTGRARIEEIRAILSEIPNIHPSPYGRIKKLLRQDIEKTRARSKIIHQDWMGVPRHGHKQFVLVGSPSAGKSSLLSLLSGMNIKTAEYQFTTLKPIPAIVKINDAQIQIVDLPGLIEGAVEDKGGGKRLIGIVKNTDGILFMIDLTKDYSVAEKVYLELVKAKIEKPIIFIGNKIDSPEARENVLKLKSKFKDLILLSSLTGEGVDELKKRIWKESGLIRVYTEKSGEPMILERGSCVKDLILKIHKNLLEGFREAVVSGDSAKFANQRVGLNHVLCDGDRVRVVSG